MSEKEPVVLCAASSYEQKYYLNEAFSGLPTAVKEELQVVYGRCWRHFDTAV